MDREALSRIKWIVFSTVALVAALLIFIGSFLLLKQQKADSTPLSPAQITDRIVRTMNYGDFSAISPSQLPKHYEIPVNVISDSSVYMSRSSDNASELSCFLLTDGSKFSALQTAISNHLNAKLAGFKDLNPVQYDALQNAVVEQDGKYVLVSVGSNSSADAKLFHEILQ